MTSSTTRDPLTTQWTETMIIKNTLVSTTLLALAFSNGSAFSDVLSSTQVSEAFSKWTGLYAGLNGGGIWSADTQMRIVSSFVPGSQTPLFPEGATYTGVQSAQGASGTPAINNAGFIGGGQIGYNWQFTDRWIGGFEADFQGIGSGNNNGQTSTIVPLVGSFDSGSLVYAPGIYVVTSLNSSKRTEYLGTLRGRLGGLVTPTLVLHGTGGLAYGGVSSSTSITQTNNESTLFPPTSSLVPQTLSSGSYSSTRCGWTAGADVEWRFMSNWSAKLEYLYYDLGQVSYALSPTSIEIPLVGPIATVASQASTRFSGNMIRASMNHHFNL